jgi:hypothetical protein
MQGVEGSVDFGIVRTKEVSDRLPEIFLNRFFMFSITAGVSTSLVADDAVFAVMAFSLSPGASTA